MKVPHPLRCPLPANGAFSLIELLVVLAVMVILTTLYWNHGPSKRDRDLGACSRQLEKMYLAMQIYANDHSGVYPVITNALTSEDALALLVPRYTSDTAIFICPATGESSLPAGKSFRDWKISYAYYQGRRARDTDQVLLSDAQVDTSSKSTGTTVFSQTGRGPGNNHGKGGGNLMRGDGSVSSTTGLAPFSLNFNPPVVLLNPKP